MVPVAPRGPKLDKNQSQTLTLAVQFACDAIMSCEKLLNVTDMESGVGNTGTRMRVGAETLREDLISNSLDVAHPFNFLRTLGKHFEKLNAGALGTSYRIFFEAAATAFLEIPDSETVDAKLWLSALRSGNGALQRYLQTEPGGKTMFDPLHSCAQAAEEALDEDCDCMESFKRGLTAAEDAVQKTKEIHKKYPRSRAHAVGIWLRAVYEAVKLQNE